MGFFTRHRDDHDRSDGQLHLADALRAQQRESPQRQRDAAPSPQAAASSTLPSDGAGNGGIPVAYISYTVQKGDTLAEIARAFYGNTNYWPSIYEVNRETLKAPDKLRAGQQLKIPRRGARQPS